MLALDWLGEQLKLLPDRALFWDRARTLLIADPHFGKDAAFRQAGVPAPHGPAPHDLARLDRLIDQTRAARLVVLGDFFHSRSGRADDILHAISGWRESRPRLDILNIRGNHDLHAGDPPPEWRITCAAPPVHDAPFIFLHEPPADAAPRPSARDAYYLAGHLHPAVSLRDSAGASLRARCFLFGPRGAILPAFGAFTGAAMIRPAPEDRVFLAGDDEVIEVAGALCSR